MPSSVELLSMKIEIKSLVKTDQIFPLLLTDKFSASVCANPLGKGKSSLLIHEDIRHTDNSKVLGN